MLLAIRCHAPQAGGGRQRCANARVHQVGQIRVVGPSARAFARTCCGHSDDRSGWLAEGGGGMIRLTAQVAIVGAGPAGLAAALALASAGVETALVAKLPTASDARTSALLEGSVKALDALGVWSRCREHAAPLRVMRIIDDTPRLL